MMIPQAVPFPRVQEMYLSYVKDMGIRSGPAEAKSATVRESKIALDKQDYSPRGTLMAPPIILQQRFSPASSCPITYSSKYLDNQHSKVANDVCSDPFECLEEVLEKPELTMSCPGERRINGTQFGLTPMEFLVRILNLGSPRLQSHTSHPGLLCAGRDRIR